MTGIQVDWYTLFLMTGIQVDWYTDACWCDWYTVRLVYLILRYTGGLVYWYFCEPLFTLPLINFVHILLSYTPLFITLWSLFCLYQASPFQFVYNFKSLFVYSFVTFWFIRHTNAPVEVSVWLGGIALWSGCVAFYD